MFVGASLLLVRIFHPRRDGSHTPSSFLPAAETRRAMQEVQLGKVALYGLHARDGRDIYATNAFLSDQANCEREAGDGACREAIMRCISSASGERDADIDFEIRNLSRNYFLYRDGQSFEIVFFVKGSRFVLLRMAAKAGRDSPLVISLDIC